MATVLTPANQRLILEDVSWETYERLLADHENRSAPRFTYDRGRMEIMSPLPEHEEYNRALEALVVTVLVEWGQNFRNLGSTTLKRSDLERGFEPDSCFYIQNADRIRGKSRIDLTRDPPPDLIIEVDFTSPSLNTLPLYAQVGVPEIWRYDAGAMSLLLLGAGTYQEREESVALAPLSASVLTSLLAESRIFRRPAWLRKIRDWARTARPEERPSR
jgi:Uma2 family endonuclease